VAVRAGWATMVANNATSAAARFQRLGAEAVPVVRPLASRNVVVPLLSLVAVPVVRPVPSRNVLVPLLSVVTVPVIRPEPSRIVVWFCADAAVIMASVSAAMVSVFIASFSLLRKCSVIGTANSACFATLYLSQPGASLIVGKGGGMVCTCGGGRGTTSGVAGFIRAGS
jgi:hypothetical protein